MTTYHAPAKKIIRVGGNLKKLFQK